MIAVEKKGGVSITRTREATMKCPKHTNGRGRRGESGSACHQKKEPGFGGGFVG